MEGKAWYEISAKEIAKSNTLKTLDLIDEPQESDVMFKEYQELSEINLAKARGFKYGAVSYSQMYIKEREKILGNWENFFTELCQIEKINIAGKIIVLGINDGQEIGFIESDNIVGVDISKEAIARGKKLYPHINFINGDLAKPIIKDELIESCISLRTLHLLKTEETEKVFCNAFNFLKEYGKIIVSVPGGFLTKDGEIIFGQRVDNELVDENRSMNDALRIYLVMEKSGFIDLRIIDQKIEIFIVGKKPKKRVIG